MAFVTLLRCVGKYEHDEPHDGWGKQLGHEKHVRYEIKHEINERSCWEYKNISYENYEKFDKDKIYKL